MSNPKSKDAPSLETVLRQFEESFDQTQDERRDAERDRDYYDNKQLTEAEEATLDARGQPPVIANRIAPKINALLGHEKRMRADPKAYPRTPKHEQEAQSATDAIRFVADANRFSAIRSAAAENLLIEGIAAATVTVKMVNGKTEVKMTHVPWDRYYRDPHSRQRNFGDAGYQGVVLWMDEDDAVSDFPGAVDAITASYSDTDGQTYDDRPRLSWSDTKRKRIRVLQHRMMHKGEWWTAIACKGGFLRAPQPSPYKDETGASVCDLIATSAYTDRDNNRYGSVRRMISPQDEINKRRSKALHLLNSRQVIAEDGAVESVSQARKEIARPDGYIQVRPGMRFEVADQSDLVAGQFNLLQESKNEIDASGVNPAIEGDASAPSGRAQEMMMTAGLAEMSTVFEALKDWSWECYKHVWYRVRQYWTDERWVRVTDDERNLKWVGINRPTTKLEQMMRQAQESGQQIPPEMLQQMQMDPELQQPVVENQLAELDVDLILEDGPDSVTIQSEQFEQLVELKRADPASIPTKMVIEASSLRNKEAILKHLEEGGVPPEVQQKMQEMEQALQQCQQALQQAEQAAQQSEMGKGVEKQEANAIRSQMAADIKVAQADLRAERAEMALSHAEWEMEQITKAQELRVKQYEAQTDRMQALKPEPAHEHMGEHHA